MITQYWGQRLLWGLLEKQVYWTSTTLLYWIQMELEMSGEEEMIKNKELTEKGYKFDWEYHDLGGIQDNYIFNAKTSKETSLSCTVGTNYHCHVI